MLPRDCDGGTEDLAACAPGVRTVAIDHRTVGRWSEQRAQAGAEEGQRLTTTEADADNTTLIAHDLSNIIDRLAALKNVPGDPWRVLAYCRGTLAAICGTLENL